MEKNYKEIMNQITTFMFDVDGVLTNSFVHISTTGELTRQMNIKDGYAIKTAIEEGYNVCIISGGQNEGVRTRLEKLGIRDVFLGIDDKIKLFEEYKTKKNIKSENILYMGDDIPDYPIMKKVAIASCPNDAVIEIKEISDYISHIKGGFGCVRDVIEQVLRVQGNWNKNFNALYE